MKSYNYLIVLINSQQNQGIALLETASPQQVADIVRIIFNLNINADLLDTRAKRLLSKNKVFKKLTNKKISENSKYRIIRNNAKGVYQLLTSSKTLLTKVLQQ